MTRKRTLISDAACMMDVEQTQASYRPDRIATLFVGESAPASGDFFYYGENAMLRHMKRATETVLGEGGDFLDRFRSYGWYLDDLVQAGRQVSALRTQIEMSRRHREPERSNCRLSPARDCFCAHQH